MSVGGRLDCASHIRPCAGEAVGGDTVIVKPLEDGCFVAIVDVLGHGMEAHELTGTIEAFLDQAANGDLSATLARLHEHLQGTRGAAAGLCRISEAGNVDYVGVGNTALRRLGSTETRLVSRDGVLGQQMRTPLPQTLTLAADEVLLLYTDGVKDRFSQHDYPAVLEHSAEEIARNIVQRFGKDYDDAACIAVRFAR